uniref:protein LURP-one-related 15-like isoform X2 n=1 Tax=Erigeron canadensis TaxID=72917 RepID=UPI001CB91B21|nr:protein LURP-one-related 15-like isoform X2 [Erigeron canadensis]
MATTTSVIGSQFISPNPLDIKIEMYAAGTLVITDEKNKIILKVRPCDTTFHRQRWILDANDIPIVKLREKKLSAHSRWNVFTGEGTNDTDIIFTTRNDNMIQFETCVNVYLGNEHNCNEDYDFQIKGSWPRKSLSIYMGNSIIANTNIEQSLEYMAAERNFMAVVNNNGAGGMSVMNIVSTVSSIATAIKWVDKAVEFFDDS